MRKVGADQQGLKWNVTHQLVVSADGVDLPGKDIDTKEKHISFIVYWYYWSRSKY
jgi:hypothetical protein